MKTILIVLAVTAVLSFILHSLFSTVSFGAMMIVLGLFVCYLGFGHEPDRPGMPSAGGGNRDVSPVSQGMMTEMTDLGSRIPVNGSNPLLLAGVISVLPAAVALLIDQLA